MDWALHADTAVVTAAIGALGGAVMPLVVARLPEPDDRADDKVAYAELAARPGLRFWYAGWSAIAAGAVGLTLGWIWPLLYLVPLVPLGVALAHIDHVTRLLPKRLVLPAYPALVVLLAVCALLMQETDDLVRAAWGWLIASALYWFLWKFTRGMGYGDVRLSGLIGLALGFLGWSELLVGVYAGFVVGVIGWIPLRLFKITKDRHFPFGPFMLVGALVGVLSASLSLVS